ncbi:hypothetical protein [Curtobacterium sp. MCBA15_012]|uniref:hypothetical protein n=1 Tax=Curtobacterium sp. MCBA15_012 TaxID=1898738 RepID=UPI002733EEA0|nr:hypothetical protein [Curtobacterium sp. MCBA15_012]WIA99716.1 hypothetical protein QOL15_14575 [Curtobacterium sp. MCBA15_012]
MAFELPTPVLPTAGTASSSSPVLPTPVTSDGRGIGVHGQGGQDLRTTIALLKTPLSNLGENGGSQHPDKRRAGGHGPTLADEVEHLLPTPTTMGGGGKTRSGDRGGELLLPGVVETLLPTPATHDSGNTPENHLRKKPGRSVVTSLQVLVDHDLIATGGRIVPPSSAGSVSPDE